MRALRVHDLLGPLMVGSVRADDVAQQADVDRCVAMAPFAVVRRVVGRGDDVAVGVRGLGREERFAASLLLDESLAVQPPESLRCAGGVPALPAYLALAEFERRFAGTALSWGPVGSVGFSLASGVPVVTAASDLDLVVYAVEPLRKGEVEELLCATQDLPCRVDVLVETPLGGVALAELGEARKLLRTGCGPRLVEDPWAVEVRA